MIKVEVIGQLLEMQNILINLPDEKSIFNFVCSGLSDIPGVEEVIFSDNKIENIDKNIIKYQIGKDKGQFGELHIKISNSESYLPYDQYLRNFILMIEVILNERKQRLLNELNQLEFGNRVEEQTKQLSTEIAEHKQAEETIKQANERLLQVTIAGGVGIWDLDVVNNKLTWNDQMFRLYGITPDNFGGTYEAWKERIHPEDVELSDVEVQMALRGEKQFDTKFRIIWPDGSIRHIAARAQVYSNTVGQPAKLIGTNYDITERKRAEEELIEAKEKAEESEKKFRELFEKSSDAILIIRNGIFVDCNQATVEMLKYNNKKEFLQVHPSELSPDIQPDGMKSLEKAEQMMNFALEKGTHRFEWDHKKSDGEVFPVEVLLTAISNEKDLKVIHTVWRDITERKKAEEELIEAKEKAEESEKKFRELFEKSSDAILIIRNGIFVDCNQATVEMLKYNNKKEFLQVHPSSLSPDVQPDGMKSLEKAEQMMNFALEKGTHRFEWDHKKSDGEVFPVEVLLTAISNEKDLKVIHTVWRDITERKKAEKELIKAKEHAEESDRLKSAFIANMSHEIRTPLNGILGFSQFLSKPELSYEEKNQFIEIIHNSGHQLVTIIDDLIDISKIDANQMKIENNPVNINDTLQELATLLKPNAIFSNIDLIFSNGTNTDQIIVLTDVNRLRQVLINLINNAIKFTKKGFVKFGYTIKNDKIEFFVEDTGIGLSLEMQPKIFDRFTQVETDLSKMVGGTGLGLSISKGIVELLGGKIWLNSTLEKGTIFYFSIPYKQVKINTNEQELIVKEKVQHPKEFNILIAEDDSVNYFYLFKILSNMNIKSIHAKNGKEAIEIVKENTTINLVLMDMKMPIIDGFEATKEIKKIRPDLPIIAQTAYAQTSDREKAIEVGCVDYISKPIMEIKMIELIRKYHII